MSLRDLLLCLFIPMLWGVVFVLAKPASEHFPPLIMLGAIYAVLAVVFSILYPGRFQTPFWPGLLAGSAAGSLQAIPLFMGLAGLDASIAVLILQMQVPFAVLTGALVNGERISPVRLLGIAVALAGVLAVAGLPAKTPPLGPVLLTIAGVAIWALGQALLKRFSRDEAPRLFRLVALHSAPQLLIGSLLLETGQIESVRSADGAAWGSFLLLAVGGFMVGNLVWYSLIRRLRLDQITPFLLAMPVIGVATSAIVLGEAITMGHLVGGGLILLGLAIVVGIARRPTLAPDAAQQIGE